MSQHSTDFDAIVIGAGFVGLYAVHRLRDQKGLRVCGIDSAPDVGGTWYWNRYPGARCDIESIHYSYSFSEPLQQEWKWSERYAAQPEILAYLNHVADRFDLRPSFHFGHRVTAMTWDDESSVWHVTTDDGTVRTAKFVVSGAGTVSIPKKPEFPGLERFSGEVYATHRWPHAGVDLKGKRVGIIGTGASGIQFIAEVAEEVKHLTVFQRTPNYAVPLRNRPTDPDEQREVLANYRDIRIAARQNFQGIIADDPLPSAKLATAAERRERFDRYWDKGGFHLLMSGYADMLHDHESNELLCEYIRERIAERVDDPQVAKLLTPTDYPYSARRPPMETNYYEVFNRSNVNLVDVKSNPIQEITSCGVLSGGTEYEVDVLVLAMGFDAFTGALLAMGITGRNGLTLNQKWSEGPSTYLGIASHGFPNLFMITGPQSAVALYNNPLAIEDHVELASDAIEYVLARQFDTIEPTAKAEQDWVQLVHEMAEQTVLTKTDSWYMGANIPGKPRGLMFYTGGAPAYREICAEVVSNGYRGFELASAPVLSTQH